MTGTAPTTTRSLNATDRCDRCGAQAYVRVVLPGGADLLFCRHHAQAHAPKLQEVATEIHDETDKLNLAMDGRA